MVPRAACSNRLTGALLIKGAAQHLPLHHHLIDSVDGVRGRRRLRHRLLVWRGHKRAFQGIRGGAVAVNVVDGLRLHVT
jgi:hypothetical protein